MSAAAISPAAPTVYRGVRSVETDPLATHPDPLKARHVAELLGVSPKTVIRCIQKGGLHGFRLGRNYYVTKAQLRDFMTRGGDLCEV